jgi:hypothetical protein
MEQEFTIVVKVTKLFDISPTQSEITALFQGRKRRVEFFGQVLKAIDPSLAVEIALDIADETVDEVLIRFDIDEKTKDIEQAESELESVITKFDKLPVGGYGYVDLDIKAQKLISSYINLPREKFISKSDDKNTREIVDQVQKWKASDKRPESCWVPIFTDWTPEERFAWASKTIQTERKRYGEIERPIAKGDFTIDSRGSITIKEVSHDRPEELKSENLADLKFRYSPGREYGPDGPNLYFVYHPFHFFPDYQIWMVDDGKFSLYYINERECLLDAFREGVLKAAGGLALGLIQAVLVPTALITAFSLPSIPALLSSVQRAGHTIIGWFLASPIKATAISGQVVTLVLAGDNVPPVLPTDEIVYVSSVTLKGGSVMFKRIIAGVIRADGKILKMAIKEVLIIGKAEAEQFAYAGKAFVFQISKAAKDVALYIPKLSLEAISHFNRIRGGKSLMRRLIKIGEPNLIEATNRFYRNEGFHRVLSEALSNSKEKRDGARFIIRFVLEEFKEDHHALPWLSFENYEPLGRVSRAVVKRGVRRYELVGGIKRFIDLRALEKIYEFKSVEKISGKIVLGDNEMGQLTRDLIKNLGGGKSAYERLKNIRYVFNKEKISLSEKEIFDKLWHYIETKSKFSTYPKSELEAMKEALKDLIMIR